MAKCSKSGLYFSHKPYQMYALILKLFLVKFNEVIK